MAAVEDEMLDFFYMSEAQLRQWVEANPERVNYKGRHGYTPLHIAACKMGNVPLTVWLLDEKGADVNAARDGFTAIHDARSLDILTALMDRGADPRVEPVDDLIALWKSRLSRLPAAGPARPSRYRRARSL